MSSAKAPGKVYFIGAGPGDPDLLTRKAWRLLSRADVVLHDALVAPEIVALAPPGAILQSVGKRCGPKSITQEQIHALLIEHARAGRAVVRLQGGDPLIFGRAGEEIVALDEAGIEFEIVPGVTAASAAAAAAQISLTKRLVASKLIFLSAHGGASGRDLGWESLPSAGATLAIYMPGSDYGIIVRELAAAGWPAETPCVVVSQAASDCQFIVRSELAALGAAPPAPAPAILLVGAVARPSRRAWGARRKSGAPADFDGGEPAAVGELDATVALASDGANDHSERRNSASLAAAEVLKVS